MKTIQDPTTVAVLAEHDCLKASGDQLDTGVFARWLASRLEEAHVANGMDEVPHVEATIGGLVAELLGHKDQQIIDMARPMLGTGFDSRVQKALSNGHVLCAGKATIQVDIEGEAQSIKIGTRFLSSDPEVIEKFALEPRRRRFESMAKSVVGLTELIETRQPVMTQRVGSFVEQLTVTWQRAIAR